MTRKINRKVLLVVALVVCVLAGGAYALYVFKVRRTAATLLDQAQRAEAAGRFEDAAGLLGNYLAYRPRDNEQRLRMGLLLEQAGTPKTKAQAISVFARVLRLEPQRADLRRRLVDLAVELNLWDTARPHLLVLLADAPNDAGRALQLARCFEANRDFPQAENWYKRSIDSDGRQLDAYVGLARLYREQLARPEQAEEVLGKMVAAGSDPVRAYLERARARRAAGALEGWAADVNEALARDPQQPDVALAAAELMESRGDVAAALALLDKARARHPDRPELVLSLAALEARAGRQEAAEARLRQARQTWPNRQDLHEQHIDVLLARGDLETAEKAIEELRRGEGAPAALAYLEARLLLQRGQPVAAVQKLEKARATLKDGSTGARQTDLLLARCHEALGGIDQRVDACLRATRGGGTPEGRLALATAYFEGGWYAEAAAECRRVRRESPGDLGADALLLRSVLLQTLRLPPARRSWGDVDEVLAALPSGEKAPADLEVRRAEVLAARGRADEARVALQKVCAAHPAHLEAWTAWANVEQQLGRTAGADRVLEQARGKAGDQVELRLARVALLAQRPAAEAAKELKQAEQEAASLRPAERARVAAAVAEALARAGRPAEAEQAGELAATLQPGQLRPLVFLAELALQGGKPAKMQEREAALRRLEGDDGTWWRQAEASRLVLEAQRGQREGLARARQLQRYVAERRPEWVMATLLKARLDELEGNAPEAVNGYLRVVKRGGLSAGVVRPLLHLLYQQKRYAEADDVVQLLREPDVLAAGLGPLAAEVSLRTQNKDRALSLARQAIPADSKDHRDHLWLGQLLGAADQTGEAEAALRRAAALAPAEPAPRLALLHLLARTDQRPKAEAALREAEESLRDAPLALAQCCEVLGKTTQVEKHFNAALKARPDDADVLRAVASYHLRRRHGLHAEPFLRRLLDPQIKAPPELAGWARRTLAVELAKRGPFPLFRQALELLEKNTDAEDVEQQRAKALVLATRSGRRAEAVDLLERLQARRLLSADELFLLARLYEAAGDRRAARHVADLVLTRERSNPTVLPELARTLLRLDETGEAAPLIEQLVKLAPNNAEAVELRARHLAAAGKKTEAVALLREYAARDDAPLVLVAAVLEEIKEEREAEALYRRAVERSRRPETALVLAGFLGRRLRVDEALNVLEKAWRDCPPQAVAVAGLTLLMATPSVNEEAARRLERDLKAAREKNPRLRELPTALATLYTLQGRLREAEGLYREVLTLEPGNVTALNNLAWVLGRSESSAAEALTLVRRAVDRVGPAPELLDTRGQAYLTLGKTTEAIRDFEQALADTHSPAGFFHLAQAQARAGRRDEARATLRKAGAEGLQPAALHPQERAVYRTLVDDLARKDAD